MLDNVNVQFIFKEYVINGIYAGLELGFIIWLASWCWSQIIHFFKAITR